MVKLIGATIIETVNALKGAHAGEEQKPAEMTFAEKAKQASEDKLKAWVRLIVSAIALGFGIYLVKDPKTQTIGASMISTVIGYWLK